MKNFFFASALIGAAAFTGNVEASTLINFDDGSFSEGENLEGKMKTVGGLTLSISGAAKDGDGFTTIFNTDCDGLRDFDNRPACTGNDSDLSSPFSRSGGYALDAGLVLIFYETDGSSTDDQNDNPSGATITFSFDIAVELLGLNLFDLAMGPKTKV